MTTIESKIDKLILELDQVNTQIRNILLDYSYLNDESKEYKNLLERRLVLHHNIFTLKQVMNY